MNWERTTFFVGATGLIISIFSLTRVHYRRLGVFALFHIILSSVGTLFPLQIAGLLAIYSLYMLWLSVPFSLAGGGGLAMCGAAIFGLLGFLLRQFAGQEAFRKAFEVVPFDVNIEKYRISKKLSRAFRPLHFQYANVERIRDLSYGPAGVRNELDIYRPRGKCGNASLLPVLIQIHGSGWMVTNKNLHAQPLMNYMASQGWVVVSINYRLSPAARFPAHLLDVKLAIDWVRKNIAEFGGDKNFIALTGGSAGGHLATLAALTAEKKFLQPGFESSDTSIKAVASLYGRYDFLDRDHANKFHEAFEVWMTRYIMPGSPSEVPELWELASPVAQINSEAPPFLIVHGGNDSLIPVETARVFAAKLRAVSRSPVVYAELPALHHGFDMVQSPATEFTVHAVHRFLDSTYREFKNNSLQSN